MLFQKILKNPLTNRNAPAIIVYIEVIQFRLLQ